MMTDPISEMIEWPIWYQKKKSTACVHDVKIEVCSVILSVAAHFEKLLQKHSPGTPHRRQILLIYAVERRWVSSAPCAVRIRRAGMKQRLNVETCANVHTKLNLVTNQGMNERNRGSWKHDKRSQLNDPEFRREMNGIRVVSP